MPVHAGSPKNVTVLCEMRSRTHGNQTTGSHSPRSFETEESEHAAYNHRAQKIPEVIYARADAQPARETSTPDRRVWIPSVDVNLWRHVGRLNWDVSRLAAMLPSWQDAQNRADWPFQGALLPRRTK